jgi:signal peptidase I
MEWKPKRWLAAVLSLLVAPLGLLYVQRPRWAIGYFGTALATQAALVVSLLFGVASQSAMLGLVVLWWVISIVAAIHAFRIASASAPASTRAWYSRWYGLLALPIAWYSGVLVFRAFLYEPFRFPSDSMYPNIRKGALVMVSKRGYGNYSSLGLTVLRTAPSVRLKRGQLILFFLPSDKKTVYLKRVIGLPGDHVECRNRRLTINSVAVPTTPAGSDDHFEYVDEVLDGESVRIAHLLNRPARDCDEVVPPGQYFVLGDNRSNSRDSRYFGMVPQANLVGGAATTFQPN